MFEFKALGLVLIISPPSELKIMHCFFCWIPYLLKNSLKKYENFLSIGSTGWEPAHPVRWISIKVHYWSRFEFGIPELVLVISPSSELRITLRFFLLDSLFFKEHSIKFSKIFSPYSIGWHLVQLVLQVSLYGTLILVVLEPKSYLVRAHKLQISPRHDLGLVMGHFVGFLQSTLSPFWNLGG